VALVVMAPVLLMVLALATVSELLALALATVLELALGLQPLLWW